MTALPCEVPYRRRVLFAIELLDPVTLERVSNGVEVVAEGLQGKPIVNASGFFVWLDEDFNRLRRVTVDPKRLPYQSVERRAAEIQLPRTTIELSPRIDYPFAAGITGLRGALLEERQRRVPVPNAATQLQWRDENSVWRDAPTVSRTDANGGFAAIVRLTSKETPLLTAGRIRARLKVRRNGAERISLDFPLRQGRVEDTDPSTNDPFTFAWDELQL